MLSRMMLIAVFGGLGSMARYGVSLAAQRFDRSLNLWLRLGTNESLPLGTLVCNVAGSFAIGALGAGLVSRGPSEAIRAALIVGLLGGFTTFSAFAFDTWSLAQRGQGRLAVLNFVLNNVLSILAVWVGYRSIERWFQPGA